MDQNAAIAAIGDGVCDDIKAARIECVECVVGYVGDGAIADFALRATEREAIAACALPKALHSDALEPLVSLFVRSISPAADSFASPAALRFIQDSARHSSAAAEAQRVYAVAARRRVRN